MSPPLLDPINVSLIEGVHNTPLQMFSSWPPSTSPTYFHLSYLLPPLLPISTYLLPPSTYLLPPSTYLLPPSTSLLPPAPHPAHLYNVTHGPVSWPTRWEMFLNSTSVFCLQGSSAKQSCNLLRRMCWGAAHSMCWGASHMQARMDAHLAARKPARA